MNIKIDRSSSSTSCSWVFPAEDTEKYDAEEHMSALGACCSDSLDKTAYGELRDS